MGEESEALTHYTLWGSFSFDGQYFACSVHSGVLIWKDSPSGYNLHQELSLGPFFNLTAPHLSPDGESIITSLPSIIHLWHTRDQILSSSGTPAGDHMGDFFLGFSPDELFAGFVRWGGSVIKVLDLRSGDLLMDAGMGMWISCLWMTENSVVVVGEREVEGEAEGRTEGQIVSWHLPGENHTFKSGANIEDSVQTTTLSHSTLLSYEHHFNRSPISVSPDLSRIVVPYRNFAHYLEVYDVSTGRCLGNIKTTDPQVPVFAMDGHHIWDKQHHLGWEIIEDSKSGTVELKPLGHTTHVSELFPFHSSRGYEVTDDGWVLNPTQERLLWLPHRWRSSWMDRTWGGRFLALLHGQLSNVVILEFFE